MAKNNEKLWRISRIALPIILAMAGLLYAYGRLNGRFEAVETEVKKAEGTRERLIRVEEGVEYLKKAVDRIEKKLER